jgi:signal transduction histidine kinase
MLCQFNCSEETPTSVAFQTGCEQLEQVHAALVRRERLNALARMASGIAHGLSNSLTPIIGYSDFLLETEPPNSEQSTKCLRAIRSAAGDIAVMVERIRQFYRTRNPEEPLMPVDLNAVVKEVIASVQPKWQDLAQRRGILISIETRLEAELPLIHENEGELREAVLQLAVNGIEAMPSGGTLALSTRRTLADPGTSLESPGQVILEVRDTGIGMDASTRERCFEPFFSTKGSRGCGLGLAAVYGLMRRHRGTIQLDTEPGEGTAVRLFFTHGDSVATPPNRAASASAPRRVSWDASASIVLHP